MTIYPWYGISLYIVIYGDTIYNYNCYIMQLYNLNQSDFYVISHDINDIPKSLEVLLYWDVDVINSDTITLYGYSLPFLERSSDNCLLEPMESCESHCLLDRSLKNSSPFTDGAKAWPKIFLKNRTGLIKQGSHKNREFFRGFSIGTQRLSIVTAWTLKEKDAWESALLVLEKTNSFRN